ncbi:hypothetical protein PVK06_027724 [Gossypium arboreum]|uniref:DUF4283 domain-containing protein n=1 Tax=Gossypium arboreum TaxID=29729 RepID=A0ABR0P112_GOSAR|nr:hypothetical protein PVK06_027724 [Gossypium arboreum]
MEEDLGNLNIPDDKEEILEGKKDKEECEEEYKLCLVGKVLINSVVHFPSIRRTLAELWHPEGGISITDTGEK